MITISKVSPITGMVNTMSFNLTPEQFVEGSAKRDKGVLIQDAYPTLTPVEREFLLSGMTEQDWDDCFGREEA